MVKCSYCGREIPKGEEFHSTLKANMITMRSEDDVVYWCGKHNLSQKTIQRISGEKIEKKAK